MWQYLLVDEYQDCNMQQVGMPCIGWWHRVVASTLLLRWPGTHMPVPMVHYPALAEHVHVAIVCQQLTPQC